MWLPVANNLVIRRPAGMCARAHTAPLSRHCFWACTQALDISLCGVSLSALR